MGLRRAFLAMALFPCLSLQAEDHGPCPGWVDTESVLFFADATLDDVAACLAAGADPMARGEEGLTPLHLAAASSKRVEVITALVDAGGDPTAVLTEDGRETGVTPLHAAAAQNEAPEIITALLRAGANLLSRDDRGMTALHWSALFNGNHRVVVRLLEQGSDVAAADDEGRTPLQHAMEMNENPEIIAALLSGGADATVRDGDGDTPLHVAAVRGSVGAAMASLLLRAGADPMATSHSGQTPLHRAAASGNVDVIALLSEAGATPSAADQDGNTPLHAAAEFNSDPRAIIALLNLGAERDARNMFGELPWDLARRNESLDDADADRWLLE